MRQGWNADANWVRPLTPYPYDPKSALPTR
jgi:hypothetical protein